MTIKQCHTEDTAAVAIFYDQAVKYLCEHINYPKWTYKEYPSEDTVKEMIANQCQFACMERNTVIGAFILNDDPQGRYEKAAWSMQIPEGEYLVCHTLATAPSRQRSGIGRQIVEFCIDYAKNHGYKAIRLDVVPGNTPAKRLYEACGFTYIGDVDLERGLDEIPVFSMYEWNIQKISY